MEAERWQRIDALFEAALRIPGPERARFLSRSCAGDEKLRREVDLLLAAGGRGRMRGRPLSQAETLPLVGGRPRSEEGRRIGSYRLLRLIGQGGMGSVYLAARDDDHYARRVAIKLIRYADAGAEIEHRFRSERQILAHLEHTNIARLYDGGSLEDGRPYLVMEYIEGLPIDAYCDHLQLTVEARLALFQQVCAAVQFAHQNLLVHRDIKPSNILVTADGVPKLLDFGIAKLVARHDSGKTTRTDLRMMTPDYASPEQILGGPITTAADVYALGVLLYELLAGVHPFRYAGRGEDGKGIVHAVCEVDPPRPSLLLGNLEAAEMAGGITPLAGICRSRQLRLAELRRRLRGDLDTIVLMALRKEPQQRYGTAGQLADDLRRHQQARPVRARGNTLRYRAAKFVRRNRAVVAALGAILLLLGGFSSTLAVQASRIVRQHSIAEQQRDKAERALGVLVDVFKFSDPVAAGGRPPSTRELLKAGVGKVDRELGGQPDLQATLLQAIGEVYLSLGAHGEAGPLFERALDLRLRAFGPQHHEVAVSLHNLATVRYEEAAYGEAERLYRRALTIRRRELGGEHHALAETLVGMAAVARQQGHFDESALLLRRALGIQRRGLGSEHPSVAVTLTALGNLAHGRGDYGEAERRFREALAIRRRAFGRGHPSLAVSLSTLGLVNEQQGDHAKAEQRYREALEIWRGSLEDGHPHVVATLGHLASTRAAQGDFEGAEVLYREVLAHQRGRLGDTHPEVATTLGQMALILVDQGELGEAEQLLREAVAIRRQALGEPHPALAMTFTDLADVLRVRGDVQAAEERYRRALVMLRTTLDSGHLEVARPLFGLGQLLHTRGENAAAVAHLGEALAIRRAALPEGHEEVIAVAIELAGCLVALERYAEAEATLLPGYDALVGAYGEGDPRVRALRERLVALYRAWGKPQKTATL